MTMGALVLLAPDTGDPIPVEVIKGSGNAENILHCRSFCTQNRIYRENVLL